jgi:quinol monooxygenase YgiN
MANTLKELSRDLLDPFTLISSTFFLDNSILEPLYSKSYYRSNLIPREMQNNMENSSIRVLAMLEAKDETRQDLLDILVPLLKPAREEDGNISYDLYCSTENPNEFLFDEVWNNKDAFNKHYESSKSYKDRAMVSGLLAKPLQIKTYAEIKQSKS